MARERKRRIRGEGAVYQRKSGDGRWVGSFKTEDMSKRKYVYGKTEKEALDKLKKAQREQEQGSLATGPKQKLGDYLNWWLEQAHKVKIRQSSYIRYKSALDTHILPDLGSIQLRKLTGRQIQDFYNKMLKERQSPSSVYTMHKVLHGGLKRAVQLRYIPHNPSDGVSMPNNEPQREGQSLTLEQVRLLRKEARGHRLEAFVTLAVTTGMRCGEILALRWEDLNFEQETIYVHRSVDYQRLNGEEKYRFIEGPPKTKASVRDVPLLPVASGILETHRAQQNEVKIKAGEEWQEKDLVFCAEHGGFWASSSVRRTFHKLLEKAGLPQIPIHDLRHTASTLWESIGISEKVKMEWLGHTSLKMTRIKYTHVLPSMQKEAAERVNTLFQDTGLES